MPKSITSSIKPNNSIHDLFLQVESHVENVDDNLLKTSALLNGVIAFADGHLPDDNTRTEIEILLFMIMERVQAAMKEISFLTDKLEENLNSGKLLKV